MRVLKKFSCELGEEAHECFIWTNFVGNLQ